MCSLPALRRRILSLAEVDYDRCQYDADFGGPELLADAFTTVISVPVQADVLAHVPELQELDNAGLLLPGRLLIRSPFDRRCYVAANEAWQHFAVAKYNAIALLCQVLGANSLEITEFHKGEDSKTAAVAAGFPGKAKVEIAGEIRKQVTESLTMNYRWAGGEPDVNTARAVLNDTGLGADPAVRRLADQRELVGNTLRSYELTTDLLAEATREISFALELLPSMKKLKLSGNFDLDIESVRSLSLRTSMKMSFP